MPIKTNIEFDTNEYYNKLVNEIIEKQIGNFTIKEIRECLKEKYPERFI